MGFERFPNTALISWMSGASGVNQTTGAYTSGTLTTLSIVCNAQPQSQRYSVGNDGNNRKVNYSISTKLITADIDEKSATVTLFDKDFTLLSLFNYQLHSELEC